MKILAFHFDDKPICELSINEVVAFRDSLIDEKGRRGRLAKSTINSLLGQLRQILDYAERRNWLECNPVSGDLYYPWHDAREYGRLVTIEEETRLLAACIGKFAPLREIIIFHADTGIQETCRLKLTPSNFDLKVGLFSVGERLVPMTPRLRNEMRSLLGCCSDEALPPAWTRKIGHSLEEVARAAGLGGLQLFDLRRTAAWRFKQANKPTDNIAGVIGMRDLNACTRLLATVDPVIAEQESKSEDFKIFIEEQFGASLSDNRQNQLKKIKNGSTNKAGRPRAFTDEQAFRAIDELGSRISVSSLARRLDCSRPTINDWVYVQGFSNLPDLVKARRSGV